MAEPHDPLELAARALRHRDRSTAELDERLARAGVGDEARAEALERLERIGYVDDERYAAARAAALAARGQGDAAIRFDLERRGIDTDGVEAALAGLETEAARARGIAEREGRTAKTARRLASKGFSPDAVREAVGESPDPDIGAGSGGVL